MINPKSHLTNHWSGLAEPAEQFYLVEKMKNNKNQNKIITFGLLGYLIFTVFVSGLDLITTFIGPQKIKEFIIPFTGWNIVSGGRNSPVYGGENSPAK